MDMIYVAVYYDWLETTEALDHTEKGRLIDAVISYARGDDGWAALLVGNERFLFPALRGQIDRAKKEREARSAKRRESGRMGGRPPKAVGAPAVPESPRPADDMPENTPDDTPENVPNDVPDDTPDDKNASADNDGIPSDSSSAADYAQKCLNNITPGHLEELREYESDMPPALVRRAVDEACAREAPRWAYVRGILDSWRAAGLKTPEQVIVPKCPTFNGEEIYWETCQTFSGSRGYFRDEETWKSPRQLIDILIDSVSKKGNLLLNVGPTARGRFDSRACARLDAIGRWMDANSRSIYGCTAAPEELRRQVPEGCKMTYNPKTNVLYLHILEWPVKVLPITFSDKVEYAQLLHDASEVQIKQPRNVSGTIRTDVPASLMLPVKKPDVEIPVVEMFLRDLRPGKVS